MTTTKMQEVDFVVLNPKKPKFILLWARSYWVRYFDGYDFMFEIKHCNLYPWLLL